MQPNQTSEYKTSTIAIFILIAAGLRVLLSEIPNIAPIAAMALFGGAYLSNKKLAFILPAGVMLLSDIVLEVLFQVGIRQFSGFHPSLLFVYASFLLIVLMGTGLKNKVSPLKLVGTGLLSSIIFFIVSNFGTWIAAGYYPMTFDGLVTCYVAAIPFFKYTAIGDLFFIGVFFGSFELLKTWRPAKVLASN